VVVDERVVMVDVAVDTTAREMAGEEVVRE
jgi:hypothetical protein